MCHRGGGKHVAWMNGNGELKWRLFISYSPIYCWSDTSIPGAPRQVREHLRCSAVPSWQVSQSSHAVRKVSGSFPFMAPEVEFMLKLCLLVHRDLETCRKMYQKQKNDPPILRNLPPVSTWGLPKLSSHIQIGFLHSNGIWFSGIHGVCLLSNVMLHSNGVHTYIAFLHSKGFTALKWFLSPTWRNTLFHVCLCVLL